MTGTGTGPITGAFGDTLAAYYHQKEGKTAAVSWPAESTFAITRLHSDVGLPGVSNPIPEERAIHVSIAIKPVPLGSYELSVDGREVAVPYIPAYRTSIIDLQSRPLCTLDCAFDYVHYHVPREGLDEITRDHQIKSVGAYKFSICEDDLVIAQLTKNVLPLAGSRDWSSLLAVDQFSLMFGAHLLQTYGGLSRLPEIVTRGLAPVADAPGRRGSARTSGRRHPSGRGRPGMRHVGQPFRALVPGQFRRVGASLAGAAPGRCRQRDARCDGRPAGRSGAAVGISGSGSIQPDLPPHRRREPWPVAERQRRFAESGAARNKLPAFGKSAHPLSANNALNRKDRRRAFLLSCVPRMAGTERIMSVNVLLVHGAWADGSCWAKVIPLLQAKGLYVTAAQIPLTSLEEDVAVTRRFLSMQTGPTVLVGHSYGGAVITGAGAGTDHVKALVYVTAFGLDEGESLASLSESGPPSPGSTAIAPDDKGFLWIDRGRFHTAFAADATETEAAVMAVVQKPLSIASFTGKSGTPAWKTIPSWYLQCTADQMIPPPAQAFLAQRMGATVRSVAASHAPFMSKPAEVAEIVALAAASLAA